MAVEFGTLHNGASPLPNHETPEGVVVADGNLEEVNTSFQQSTINQIRQGVLCEKLGFNYFFMTEHHFQPEGAENSPSPLLAQAAVAARTKKIRLGQAANILTWWDPLRLAVMGAMLDVISGGRLEFGLGRGYQPREVETFGRILGSSVQDQERNRRYFEETWEVIKKAWTQPSFSHTGTFFQIPPSYTVWDHPMTQAYFKQPDVGRKLEEVVNIEPTTATLKELQMFPRPVQKPYPQTWMPLTSERSIRWAAQNGVNGYTVVEHSSRLRRNIEIYMEEAEKAGWPDRLDRGPFKYGWDAEKHRGFITGKWVMITTKNNHKELQEKADAAMRLQWDYYTPFGFPQALTTLDESPWPSGKRPTADDLREREVLLIGSKDEVIDKIMKLKEDGQYGEDFIFNTYFDFGGMSGPELEEQLCIYSEEVMPVLREECGGGVDLPASDVELEPEARVHVAER
ncbi:MAG: LLM class flavin-dependent oxidoreductase [Pseudonocardiaceae bacterium]|nr:LLM class flavin-dependent oxidoreductase [Pseudonocardiaceae bacterium]